MIEVAERVEGSASARDVGGGREFWARLVANPGGPLGLTIVGLYLALALLANQLAPFDPDAGSVLERLHPPDSVHWLGTDELGRDVLSRMVYGARVSLEIQMLTVALALLVGVTWGLLCGFFGGWLDDVSMRIIDILMAFPGVFLAIAIVAVVGPGFLGVILAVAVVSFPGFVRLTRGIVLGLRDLDFVQAAHAVGESKPAVMVYYVLPGSIAPLIVQTSLRMATVLLTAAGLSYLGLGVQPPQAEWGAMLSNARSYIFTAPYLTIIPGVAITLVVIGFNVLGDALRTTLDPRMS
jgi:peptide/nickel transport system permease protein